MLNGWLRSNRALAATSRASEWLIERFGLKQVIGSLCLRDKKGISIGIGRRRKHNLRLTASEIEYSNIL